LNSCSLLGWGTGDLKFCLGGRDDTFGPLELIGESEDAKKLIKI